MVTRLKHYNPSARDMVNDWQVLDASGQVLGRFATQVAMFLMGKNKPEYVPHMLSGDFVVVINAREIKVTGRKAQQKIYKRYSQYPGTLKEIPYERMQARFPERIIEMAVKGMLPKNKLGRRMLKRLKVYAGPEHPHSAQVIGSDRRESREAEALAKAETAAAAAAIKKATAEKQAAKEALASEVRAEAAATVAVETPARKVPAKKAPAKKATARKTPAKKATARKPAAKKPAARKPAAKKPAVKKATTARKPAARKPAARKTRQTTTEKTTARKSGDSGEK
ncbi:MAG: 50S ribosomal protein L13 [Chloroflexi bacterium]|nr:50S ribosomal protein L13 [Chloroflexota bacterium]MCH8114253.1 50S ribosomal protein L13 [Chloroflexota bacterium]MCI0775369.1 50S ribosomal protein L13 [Chloroflexota bacterium]MCI0804659.1 50S ribosomal protein L13 [Chloroflexota bacterium]MCI0808963.1 50S ribosomal protein L13 [Chloroflexota bacterium]